VKVARGVHAQRFADYMQLLVGGCRALDIRVFLSLSAKAHKEAQRACGHGDLQIPVLSQKAISALDETFKRRNNAVQSVAILCWMIVLP
jgi:hypothetical protein